MDMCWRILTSGAVISEAFRWLGLEELGYTWGGGILGSQGCAC